MNFLTNKLVFFWNTVKQICCLIFFYLPLLLFTLDSDMIHCIFREDILLIQTEEAMLCTQKISVCLFDTSQIPLHFSIYSKDTKKKGSMKRKESTEVKFWIERTFWLPPRYTLEIPLGYTLHTNTTGQTNLQWKHWGKVVFVWLCYSVGHFLWKLAHKREDDIEVVCLSYIRAHSLL